MRDEASEIMAVGAAGPLAGRRVAVTRPGPPGERLVAKLESLGAVALHAPLTRIAMAGQAELTWRLAAREFEWVLFTSANGVRATADAARDVAPVGRSLARVLGGTKVAAVGRATAEALHDQGCDVVVVPGRFDAESLLDALERRDDVHGARVLHPAAAGARAILWEGLERLGAVVTTVIAYESVPDRTGAAMLDLALAQGSVDLVTFFAPSAVEACVAAVGTERARRIRAASVGPVTSQALAQHGIPIEVEAPEATADQLVAAIATHYIRSA